MLYHFRAKSELPTPQHSPLLENTSWVQNKLKKLQNIAALHINYTRFPANTFKKIESNFVMKYHLKNSK